MTIGNGTTCSVIVTFTPSASVTSNDTFDINYNDGAAAQTSSRDVRGSGSAAALLVISDGAVFNFGTLAIGATLDKSFTINNTGSISATAIADGLALAAPFTFKGGTYPGTGGNCGTILTAAGTCSIVVTYAPTTSGAHNDTIVIDYNDGSIVQQSTRAITGTGALPATLTINESPLYDYGTNATGSTADHTFTVGNTGGIAAASITGSGLAAPFSFKGGSYPGTGGSCGTTLAAAANCTIIVTYAPTVVGTQTDTID